MSSEPHAALAPLLQTIDHLNLPADIHIVRNNANTKWHVERHPSSPSPSVPLTRLGPFGFHRAQMYMVVTSTEGGIYRIDFRGKLETIKDFLPPNGLHGPVCEIQFSEEERKNLLIPPTASHYCWCNPPTGMAELSEEKRKEINTHVSTSDPEWSFLAFGGFLFLQVKDGKFSYVRATALEQSESVMTFGEPSPWKRDFTHYLYRKGRFEKVTISALKDMGIRLFAYVAPNEALQSNTGQRWTPCPKGGFVYLYNPDASPHPMDRFFAITSVTAPLPASDVRPFSMVIKNTTENRIKDEKSGGPSKTYDYECVICMAKPVACIFVPCKHMCTCQECGQKIRHQNEACPLCRADITDAWDVFL